MPKDIYEKGNMMKGVKSVLLIILGIALIMIGLRGPILLAAGTMTTASITDVKQYVKSNSSKSTDHNYQVFYSFTDSAGKEASGSYIRYNVYDVMALPDRGERISVRYLSFLSGINVPAETFPLSWADAGCIAAGAALLIGGIGGLRGQKAKASALPQNPVYYSAPPQPQTRPVYQPVPMATAYCAGCGAPLQPDAGFCPNCGKARSIQTIGSR